MGGKTWSTEARCGALCNKITLQTERTMVQERVAQHKKALRVRVKKGAECNRTALESQDSYTGELCLSQPNSE